MCWKGIWSEQYGIHFREQSKGLTTLQYGKKIFNDVREPKELGIVLVMNKLYCRFRLESLEAIGMADFSIKHRKITAA